MHNMRYNLHQSSGRFETIPSSRSVQFSLVHGGRNCEVVCTVYKRNIFFYLFHFIQDCATTSTYFRLLLVQHDFFKRITVEEQKKRYERNNHHRSSSTAEKLLFKTYNLLIQVLYYFY